MFAKMLQTESIGTTYLSRAALSLEKRVRGIVYKLLQIEYIVTSLPTIYLTESVDWLEL